MSTPISTTIHTHGAATRYAVNIYHDHDHASGAPWNREDGHGPVRYSRSDCRGACDKRPGERPMHGDGRGVYVYDWQAAMRTARTDKWGIDPAAEDDPADFHRTLRRVNSGHDPLGEWLGLTRGEIAERAVQADYDRLAGWLRDEWHYVGVAVVLLGADDAPLTGAYDHALWGIESDSGDAYIDSVAGDLLADALAARPLPMEFAEAEGWALIDVDSTGLHEIERDDAANLFAHDYEAVAHVAKCARAGSDYHARALAIHYRDAAAVSTHRAATAGV